MDRFVQGTPPTNRGGVFFDVAVRGAAVWYAAAADALER